MFATEQQASFEWGVEAGASGELTVFEGADHEWQATPESLGSFLRGVILLHVSTCTLDWEGGAEVARARCEGVLRDWDHISFRPLCAQLDFYVRGSVVLRCDWSDRAGSVFVGGKDETEVHEVARSLGLATPEAWPDDAF